MVGFFFVGKTCLDFHAELDNTSSKFSSNETTPKPMKGAKDICQGFLCTDDPNGTEPVDLKCITDLESKFISKAQLLASQLQKAFNTTYRQGRQQIGLFKYTGGSNTFFNYNTLKKRQSGTLMPEDFFVEASALPAVAMPSPLNVSSMPLRRQGPPQNPSGF